MVRRLAVFAIAVVLGFGMVVSCAPEAEKAAQQVSKPLPIELGVTIPVETELDRGLARPAVDIWLDMIRHAEKTLDLGHFYLVAKPDGPLEPVIRAVLAAKKRGVRVRILTEKRMNNTYPELAQRFREAGIEVRLFDWSKLTGGILHAKYMIADNRSLYVGSQNFDWRALSQIHETGIRVDRPAFAQAAEEIFQLDWDYAGGDEHAYERIQAMKPVSFPEWGQLLASPGRFNPPGVEASLPRLIQLLDGAKERISVQLLSYGTHRYRSEERFTEIDDALRRAADRGVEVEMILSNWAKRHPEDLKSLSAVDGIQVRFINIPQPADNFIPFARVAHSKVVRVDDIQCWISTSNWSYDYFYSSRNLDVLIHDRDLALQLDRLFTDLWNSPYEEMVTPEGEYEAPRRE